MCFACYCITMSHTFLYISSTHHLKVCFLKTKSFVVCSDASSINWQSLSGLDQHNRLAESVQLCFDVDTDRPGMWSSTKKSNYSDQCSWMSSSSNLNSRVTTSLNWSGYLWRTELFFSRSNRRWKKKIKPRACSDIGKWKDKKSTDRVNICRWIILLVDRIIRKVIDHRWMCIAQKKNEELLFFSIRRKNLLSVASGVSYVIWLRALLNLTQSEKKESASFPLSLRCNITSDWWTASSNRCG